MDINWLSVAVATIAGIAVGSLWFGPRTFFPVWWRAMGKTPEDQPGGANMAVVFGGTFVAIFVQALILAVILSALDQSGVVAGVATGALLGLVGASASLTHTLFGGQSRWAWLLEAGSDIVGLAAMGAVIGLFV
jgi:hypothetical protein